MKKIIFPDKIIKLLRWLPAFRGKFKIASILCGSILNSAKSFSFQGKHQLKYCIPNTIETIGKELMINGIYEKETVLLIQELLKESGIFFDVGANIGSIILPVAKKKHVKVHAFEPSHFSYPFLEKNVFDNQLQHITLNNKAVHSSDGLELTFYESEEKYGHSSLSSTYSDQPHYKIHTISLDAYCERNKIKKINVLKIDVQGYEVEVLRGAIHLLKQKAIDNIIFEMEDWAEKQAGFNAGAAQKFLVDCGYELFSLDKERKTKIYTEGTQMFLAKPLL